MRRGHNQIELDFESGIAEANRAVTRYVDTQDGNEYLYTLFVPMDASLAFPCFRSAGSQSPFHADRSKPLPTWVVVSNTAGTSVSGTTRFEETKPISTYLFAFAAGPFETLDSSGLRLYVRKSMLARAKEEWPGMAETTRKGMKRMAEFLRAAVPVSEI